MQNILKLDCKADIINIHEAAMLLTKSEAVQRGGALMKEKILKILRERDAYISGQELCGLLGVSRTAVWKTMHQLTDEGYEIEAVNKKGYRLLAEPDIVTVAEIASQITPGAMGSVVHCYEEIGSTNDEAKLLAEQGAAHGTLVVADMQTRGKGRRLREWSSQKAMGIFMTVILRPEIAPENASMITLLAAMAVYDTLSSLGIESQIKWPNDIVIDGKKVCGILTEMSAQPDYVNYIVVGIGINVHQREFPGALAEVAASLDMAAPEAPLRRSEIIARVMTAFEGYYNQFLNVQKLDFIRSSYNERLVNMGKEVYIMEKNHTKSGKCLGIDENGCLIAVIDGTEEHILSGEVSVRGVLGYV